jgi:alkaline phosphatase
MVLTNEEIAKVKADFEIDLAKLLANMIKKKDAVEYLTVSKQRLGIRLGKLISKRAGVSWAHTHHSGQPVILSAEGCCADLFKKGKIENSEVGKILKSFYQNN